MKVTKLLHTRYRVDDLDRTLHFYTDILGLEIISRHESPRGSKIALLRTPNSDELLEISSYPPSGPVKVQPDLTHLAFQVDNLEEFAKYLATKGIPLTDGPTISKTTGTHFAFIDAPEGYEIELIQKPQ